MAGFVPAIYVLLCPFKFRDRLGTISEPLRRFSAGFLRDLQFNYVGFFFLLCRWSYPLAPIGAIGVQAVGAAAVAQNHATAEPVASHGANQ